MDYRIGIQILSYNKPKYLAQTLASLIEHKGPKDKIIVFEQSTDKDVRQEGLAICKEYDDIQVILSTDNLGQRGATNKVIETGFFDNCEYVMLTDHDNLFHQSLDIYVDVLKAKPLIWVATGYNSPEHDIENKDGAWLLKTTARAGHMVLRQVDFMSLTPLDEKAGLDNGCAWFAGLDWLITHWHVNSPGLKRFETIASYPGGVEHIGRESTWQGKYDDEYTVEENLKFRNSSMEDIVKWYIPRHTYQEGKYWYEKVIPTIVESTPTGDDSIIKALFKSTFNKDVSDSDLNVISKFIDASETLIPIVVSCSHYYSPDLEEDDYMYSRDILGLERWRQRIRKNIGNHPIIVFDDGTDPKHLDRILNNIDEPADIRYIDNDTDDADYVPFDNNFVIYSFTKHLGRIVGGHFKGWYRSYKAALSIECRQLFYIEKDLLLNISDDTINTNFDRFITGSHPQGIESCLQIMSHVHRELLLDKYNDENAFNPENDIEYIIGENDLYIIPGIRADESDVKFEMSDNSFIANPSNNHVAKFDGVLGSGIVAFNYIWPSYGDVFLEQSIRSIIEYVDEYIIFLTKYSYIGTECDPNLYQRVKDVCASIGVKNIRVVEITDPETCALAKSKNVEHYFRKVVDFYMDNDHIKYVWMVQSDEVYDDVACNEIINWCRSGDIEHCLAIQAKCYFGSPQWAVHPMERFDRPTVVRKRKDLSFHDRIVRTDVHFNHYSYVLTPAELDIKLSNWGHRNDIDKNEFMETFDDLKSNKHTRDLHPIHPPTYESVVFDDSELAKANFRFWLQSNCSTIKGVVHFIQDNLMSDIETTYYYTNTDPLGLSTVNTGNMVAIVDDYDTYLDIYKYSDHNVHFGSLNHGLQFIEQESIGLFIYHLDVEGDARSIQDDLVNIYSKLINFGWGCVIYKTDSTILDQLRIILKDRQIADKFDQKFGFKFRELDYNVIDIGEYSVCLFNVNLNNPVLDSIIDERVIFGPFVGEFGWELTRWAPMVNMFKQRNPDVDVCIATDKDSFGLYTSADHTYAISVPDDTRDGFRNTGLTQKVVNRIIEDMKSVFPGYRVVSPDDFDPVLNVFSWEDRYVHFNTNHSLEERISVNSELISIAISSRYIENKARNWSRDNWETFYQLINSSNKYFAYVVGKSPTIVKFEAGRFKRIVYVEDLVTPDHTLIDVTIAALRLSCVTIGQQSSLPILSQFVETPTIMFGHRKYRNMNFDNPRNVRKGFIESPNYDIDPVKLYTYMDNFISKLEGTI